MQRAVGLPVPAPAPGLTDVNDDLRSLALMHGLTHLLDTLIAALGRFRSARRGNVALIFALTALPIIGAIGGAVDFGVAVANKSRLQDAVDSAALAGARAASAYISSNGTGTAQIAQAISLGNSVSQSFFMANFAAIGGQSAPVVSANTTITNDAPSVVLTASTNYSPFMLSLVGIRSIPLTVSSTAVMTPNNSYYQIIFVVDVSGSMSIGGDPATISTLQNQGAFYCAFACHDPNNYEGGMATNWCDSNPSDTNCLTSGPNYCPTGSGTCPMVYSATMTDKRSLAKRYGYNLKIDYVNSAVQGFMSQLSAYNLKYPGRFTVGINTFGEEFTVLLPPTTNTALATTAAANLDVEPIHPANYNWGHTRTTLGLTSTLSNLTNIGDGSSPTKMLTYVVFLTDAVEDIEGNQIYGRQADLNYITACTSLKNAGVNMFTIWAPYYTIPNDYQYSVLVSPLTSQMTDTMKNCASNPTQYFQANDGAGITAAVNTTFNNIIANSNLRIKN